MLLAVEKNFNSGRFFDIPSMLHHIKKSSRLGEFTNIVCKSRTTDSSYYQYISIDSCYDTWYHTKKDNTKTLF